MNNTRVTPATLSEVIMHCPLCDSEKIKSLGPVRTPLGIFEKRECETCGEKFNIDDNGNEVR